MIEPEYDFADTDTDRFKKRIAVAGALLWCVAVYAGLRAVGAI